MHERELVTLVFIFQLRSVIQGRMYLSRGESNDPKNELG